MPPSTFPFGPVKCSSVNIAEFLDEIQVLLKDRTEQPRTISCVNAHIFNLAWNDTKLAEYLNCFRIVTVDGMSIVWAARLLGVPIQERCNMTEAFRAFLQDSSFPSTTAILLGDTEETARLAAEKINASSKHTKVLSYLSGYLDDEDYVAYLRQKEEIDFLFLGMGTPKSERLVSVLSGILPNTIVWHIGGGTIQILAEHLVEAPLWMRRSGLQWVHRLFMQPGKMWKRYLIGNVLFLWRYLALAIGNNRGR